MPETVPRAIGRYEIQRELGRGMMGVVYEAHDPALGRRIALKTIQLAFAVSDQERKAFQDRFLAEARLAARLSHPGIVVVHDVGQDPTSGTLYIALELLQGHTLAEIVGTGNPVDWRKALGITKQVAEALQHAHAEGVVHRDIKPANIMMLRSGEAKIMDFGIAKVETSQLTATGQFFGTPLYMSPEQALGRKVDGRSDLFSLGTVAYGLLTGRQAFGGASVPQIVTRVVQENPPPPTQVVRTLPVEIDSLIARALAKDPAYRYPNGRTMAEDVEDILAGRPPRHKRSWVAPPRAEGTVVSGRGPQRRVIPAAQPGATGPDSDAGLESLILEPVPEAVPRARTAPRPAPPARPQQRRPDPPRQGFPWIAVAALACLAVAAAIVAALVVPLGGPRPMPAVESVTADAEPSTVTTLTSAPSAAPPDPLPASSPTLAPASPEPEPRELPKRPQPVAQPRPAPAEPVATESPAGESAQLELDFEHSLKDGRLRVWVDDALAIEQDLDSRVTRKIASLKLRKGSVEQTLAIPAGRHEVKVEVAWDDNVRTARIWAQFEAGSTRRLSAKLGAGIGGLVRKSLDLQWE